MRPFIVRALRWCRQPLGLLLLAAVAAVLCGLFLHPRGFLIFAGILAISFVGILWPWMSVLGLSGRLEFEQPRGREGDEIALRVFLENRLPWGVWGIAVRGGFPAGGESAHGDAIAESAFVPGRGSLVRSVLFVPRCRGVFPTEVPRLTCGFPFGLWEASRPLAVTSPLIVWPRSYPVARLPEPGGQSTFAGSARRDRPGQWGDPLGVRRYRRGDSLRLVHWALTARHGELIVRELQTVATARVLIVLDSDSRSHPGEGTVASLESAIRVAASLSEGWVRQGASVDLLLESGPVSTGAGGAGREQLTPLLDALARLPSRRNRDLSGLLQQSHRCGGDHGFRVVITTDLGLARLDQAGPERVREHYVCLRCSGSEPGSAPAPAAQQGPRVWMEIEDPVQLPLTLLRVREAHVHE